MVTTQQVGGSSSQTNAVIDPDVILLSEFLKPLLRIDYSSARESEILTALSEITAHVISEVPDQAVIKDTLDEFSPFAIWQHWIRNEAALVQRIGRERQLLNIVD
jgi:hypothetical protein